MGTIAVNRPGLQKWSAAVFCYLDAVGKELNQRQCAVAVTGSRSQCERLANSDD